MGMSGIFSNAGYIYQQRVIIYQILKSIINKDIADCKIELTFQMADNQGSSYSLDFFILSNNEKKKRFFEVKDRKDLKKKSIIKPILDNFYKTHENFSDSKTEFVLIHSTPIVGNLKKFYMGEEEKLKTIKFFLGDKNEVENFAKNITFEHFLDNTDQIIDKGILEMRSTYTIRKILQEFEVSSFEKAEVIYGALGSYYQNIVKDVSDRLKEENWYRNSNTPTSDSVQINLKDLIDFQGSFIDQISNKFDNKDEARKGFYKKFNIPNQQSEVVQP